MFTKNTFTVFLCVNSFTDVMRCLRFDNKNHQSESIKSDKFIMARYTWEKFIENPQSLLKPNEFLTADEQLFPCKIRFKFKQFMPNKPDKFGIKFWLLVDFESKYIVNGFPYLGKDQTKHGIICKVFELVIF